MQTIEIGSEHGTFRFSLVKPDAADVARAQEAADRLDELYVGEGKEFPLRNEDDSPIRITPTLTVFASMLSILQRKADADGVPSDTYTADEYLALSFTLPDVFLRLQVFYRTLGEKEPATSSADEMEMSEEGAKKNGAKTLSANSTSDSSALSPAN